MEDTRHVCQCPDPGARDTWRKALLKLEEWMDEADTDPMVTKHILTMLQTWSATGRDITEGPSFTVRGRALSAQTAIGGWNTILGRVSSQLEAVQDQHYRRQGKRNTGFRWTVAIIKKLQDISWDMWDHRNGILHNDPTRHHKLTELEAANSGIADAWRRGPTGLLARDRFLFRDQNTLMAKPLEKKIQWLTAVSLARQAAREASSVEAAYEQERQGLATWLAGSRSRPARTQITSERNKRKKITRTAHTTTDSNPPPRPTR